jgi:hypothetical protein
VATDETPDLVAVLLARIRDAAKSSSLDQRAWALVRTAAALRRSGSYPEAIGVLDDAVELRPAWDVERAALTCAVSPNCDAVVDHDHLLVQVELGDAIERLLDRRALVEGGTMNETRTAVV